jgi:diguanylate cyclase (GGDEF)-like protein
MQASTADDVLDGRSQRNAVRLMALGVVRGVRDDPPLIDRLMWREGIFPQTLVAADRGLMARTFGTLFAVGGLIGLVSLAIGESDRAGLEVALISALSFALGAVCFVGYRRLPIGFFAAVLAVGTAMITAGMASSDAPGSEGVYGFFYVWVVFMAYLFFSARAATAQALIATVAFAVVLFTRDAPFATNLLIAAVATFGAIGVLTGVVRAHVERMVSELASEAHTDPVTAITNRRGFDLRFTAEIDRARRLGRPLSLVICDLDRFKAVNDELGHGEGDLALRRAAVAIGEAVRGGDTVARLGGEEFAIVLPETRAAAALSVAERIRHGIRIEFEGFPVAVTVSCGVASLGPELADDELFRAADTALYAAKRAGRNATAVHGREHEAAIPLRRVAVG